MISSSFLRDYLPFWFAIAVISLCLAISSKLTSTADTRVFLGDFGEGVSDLREFEETFGRRSTLQFLVHDERSSENGTIPIDLLQHLESRIWALENVTSVVSVVSVNHIYKSDDEVNVALIHELASPALRRAALEKTSSRGILSTNDLAWWSVAVEIDLPVGLPGRVVELNKQIEEIVRDTVSNYEGSSVQYTGEISLMAEFSKSAARDSALLVPISLLIVLLLFALFIRSWRITVVLLFLLAMAISLALALQALFGAPVNTATATIPLIVLIVVSANVMHFFWAILYRTKGNSENTKTLVMEVRKQYVIPLAISGFSTAGGFFLLLLASSPPFYELGWVVGVVVAVSTIAILYWVPLAISCYPKEKLGRSSELVSRISAALFLVGQGEKGFRLTLVLTAFSVSGLALININDDFTSYFPEDSSYGVATSLVEEKFGGSDYLEIVQYIDPVSDSSDGLIYLKASYEFSSWIRRQPGVKAVISLQDTLSEISEVIGGDRVVSLEELLLVYEMGLPDGRSISDRITLDRSQVRTTVLLGDSDSDSILALKGDIESKFPVDLAVTGVSVPTSLMALTNTSDVFFGVAFAASFVALLMFLLNRNIFLALTVFGFVLLPLGIGFGVWGWFFSDVGLATAAILAASVGIVVDDVVHVVYRYAIVARSGAHNSETAIVQVMKEVAPPIAISSAAVAAGFGVLMLSNFGVNSALGFTVSLIVLSAFFVVLVLLPRFVKRIVF